MTQNLKLCNPWVKWLIIQTFKVPTPHTHRLLFSVDGEGRCLQGWQDTIMDWHCIYKKSEECIAHMLLHCEVVTWLVGFDFPSFQERVGNVPTGVGVSGSWIGQFDNHHNLEAWRTAPFVWCGASGENATPETLKIAWIVA